ncbi:MAG: FAD-dependent oxidoreductase, partial [Candidatus Kerfeldbacteria bacterium]|nr:FAD-dependent oxidoreductase [Candidatus Kerfeldbacteria bacterium]
DALTIHERCAVLIHRAMHEGTPSKIVVAGAGVAGVETASQLRFYLNHRLPHSGQAAGLVTVELIEGAPMILPGMETWVQEAAVARLQALGVEIKTGLTIAKVDRQGIELRNGQRRNYDLLMWCGGIKAHHLLPALNVACSGKGQVCVEADLTIPGHPHVSVVGDGAAFVNPATGQPLPQVATVAVSQGRVAANNILAHMSGAPSRAYQPVEAGYVFPVGGRWAISTIGHRRTGFSAWWVRKKVDLLYYLSILRWRHALEVFWHGGQVYLRKD